MPAPTPFRLVNTFLGMAINAETRRPMLGTVTGGLSGPAIKPIALRMVWDVYKAVKVPIIGMGGIMNATDAIEFILAGSTAIQIGTANFIDPAVSIKDPGRDRRIYGPPRGKDPSTELIGGLRSLV